MLNTIDKILDGMIKASAVGMGAILVWLLAEMLWEEFGDDIKNYCKSQWESFKKWQTETPFVNWCQRVVEAISLKGFSWNSKQSRIFTKVDRETMNANTVFQVDGTTAFKSEGYVIVDGDASGSFVRATGEIVEMTDSMAKVLHSVT